MAAGVVYWLALLLAHQELLPCPRASALDRGQFPDSFLFGTSTSAYQGRAHPVSELGQPPQIPAGEHQ